MATLTSFLKSLFPFKGYKLSVLENGDSILIQLKSRRKCGICPCCGKRCKYIETKYERTLRDLDLADHKCFLKFLQKKIRCKCDYRGLEKLDFVNKNMRVTNRLAEKVAHDCEEATIKEIARKYDLDWKTVKKIDKEHIKSLLPKIEQLKIRRIAIDEIAIMKGHKYFTLIRDYDTGVTIKIIFGRGYEEVLNGLASLGKEKLVNIYFASMDMWDPYIKVIKELCPNVKLVFDKFHVVKKINEALDNVRKTEFINASSEERINMKHKRWIILKKESNLEKEEKETLNQLMNNNEKLYKAYLLKEQIISIFADVESSFDKIQPRIEQWFENILNNEMNEFYGIMQTMQNYFYGIINYFKYGMTNAIAEGFNTKINIIKRRAFGFRDIEYFALKIFQSTARRLA